MGGPARKAKQKMVRTRGKAFNGKTKKSVGGGKKKAFRTRRGSSGGGAQ